MSHALIRGAAVVACLGAARVFSKPAHAFKLLVSNEKDNTITVIDSETFKVIKTVNVGARQRGIALSPDGKSLYICKSDADHLEVLDLNTPTVTRILPSGADPEFFALH